MAVYVKNNMSCTHLYHYSVANLETLWILCRYPRMPRSLTHILIGVIYHPPDGDKHSMISHILDCLDQTSHQHPNLGIILVGDFNQLRTSPLGIIPYAKLLYQRPGARLCWIKSLPICMIGTRHQPSYQLV